MLSPDHYPVERLNSGEVDFHIYCLLADQVVIFQLFLVSWYMLGSLDVLRPFPGSPVVLRGQSFLPRRPRLCMPRADLWDGRLRTIQRALLCLWRSRAVSSVYPHQISLPGNQLILPAEAVGHRHPQSSSRCGCHSLGAAPLGWVRAAAGPW